MVNYEEMTAKKLQFTQFIFPPKLATVEIFKSKHGPLRESNSGPLAPEARIIPLNQAALTGISVSNYMIVFKGN